MTVIAEETLQLDHLPRRHVHAPSCPRERLRSQTSDACSTRRRADETGIRSGFPQAPASAGLVALWRGDIEEARRWREKAHRFGEGTGAEPVGAVFAAWLDSLLAAEDGRGHDALAQLGGLFDVLGLIGPGAQPWVAPELIDLAIAAGERDRAGAVAAAVAGLASTSATASAEASAAWCRAAITDEATDWAAAAVAADRGSRPHLAARARVRSVEVGSRAGSGAAHPTRMLDAPADAERAFAGGGRQRARPRRLAPKPHRHPVHLASDIASRWRCAYPAEATVLALIGDGLDNGQVARRLQISKRTVESHVAKLYLKLGVSGRVALAREAAARER